LALADRRELPVVLAETEVGGRGLSVVLAEAVGVMKDVLVADVLAEVARPGAGAGAMLDQVVVVAVVAAVAPAVIVPVAPLAPVPVAPAAIVAVAPDEV